MSPKILEEIKKAENVILVENNVTGQLGRLIRERFGIKIEKKILKYDGRPFTSDELKKEIKKTKW
jgi:2-oxoglutarate/2-oxoacid ferredoxin oxidoreductase subunit alpha